MNSKCPNPPTAKSKTTISLSLDTDIVEEIRSEAENNGTSINSRINEVLRKYVIYDKFTQSLKCILIANKTFKEFLKEISEDTIVKEFKANMDDLVPSALYERDIPITFESVIKFSVENLGLNSGVFHSFSNYKDRDDHIHIVLNHNYGIKWSQILGRMYGDLFQNLLKYHSTITALQNRVDLKIVERNI